MRITGRWAARHSTHPHVRAGSKTPDHGFQPTGYELAEAERRGQHEESPAARPGYRGDSGANPPTVPALGLDQQQAALVIAALEDAAALRRETIGNCPDCRSADERVCNEHEGSWEAAEEYDSLRWHLDITHRESQPNHEAGAATAGAPAEHLQPTGHNVGGDQSELSGQMAGGLESGQAGLLDQAEPEDYVPSAVTDTSRGMPPEVYAIADYGREVKRPKSSPHGKPSTSPEGEVSPAEWLSEDPGDPGPAEEQIIGWNRSSGYEADREPGE